MACPVGGWSGNSQSRVCGSCKPTSIIFPSGLYTVTCDFWKVTRQSASHISDTEISAVFMSGKTCAVVAFSGIDGMSNFPVSVACMWLELAHCTMRPFGVGVLLRRRKEVVTKCPVAAVSICPSPVFFLFFAVFLSTV